MHTFLYKEHNDEGNTELDSERGSERGDRSDRDLGFAQGSDGWSARGYRPDKVRRQ